MSLTVLDHPAARHYLTRLRDKDTPHDVFRDCCRKLTLFLAIEATRDLAEKTVELTTPQEKTEGNLIAEKLVIVPILRAGLGMLPVFVDMLPGVAVGYVGMERDETTAAATSYYCKLPPIQGRRAIVIDPMLATGGSAEAVISRLMDEGAGRITLVTIVAAPEGVARLEKKFPSICIHTAALDRCLSPSSYILPGLGDFGDRLFGT